MKMNSRDIIFTANTVKKLFFNMQCEKRYAETRGISLVELLITISLILILTTAVMPLAKVAIKRQKEAELRRVLRIMRDSIDKYHDMAMPPNGGPPLIGPIKYGSEGYPPDFQTLIEGASLVNSTKKIKFLRRIPVDPMTGSNEWGLRCYTDEPDSEQWCGDNIYDVYSKSKEEALDGTHYDEW